MQVSVTSANLAHVQEMRNRQKSLMGRRLMRLPHQLQQQWVIRLGGQPPLLIC
jgi:hypothetical protein